MKTCKICGQEKDHDKFAESTYGSTSQCKQCLNERRLENKRKRKERLDKYRVQ